MIHDLFVPTPGESPTRTRFCGAPSPRTRKEECMRRRQRLQPTQDPQTEPTQTYQKQIYHYNAKSTEEESTEEEIATWTSRDF